MTKCGKSFLPECEYFTTGGCISPFNCPYKIEHESITTATSTPLNSNVIYTDETYKDKEIARLTAENAGLQATISKMERVEKELRARLDKAVELPCKAGDTVYFIPASISKTSEFFIMEWKIESIIIMEKGYTLNCVDNKKRFCYMFDRLFGIQWFTDRTKAEARLAELKGE